MRVEFKLAEIFFHYGCENVRLNSTSLWNYSYKIILAGNSKPYVTVGGCCIKSVATLFSQKVSYITKASNSDS